MKVITLNLRNWTDDHWKERLPLIVADIKAYDADILAFQEVRGKISDPTDNMAQELQDQLPDYPDLIVRQAMDYPDIANWEGLAILSKLRSTASGVFELPLGGVDDANKRILMWASYSVSGQTLHVFNNHFSYNTSQAKTNAQNALNDIKDLDSGPSLFVGDLNVVPDSPESGAITYLIDNGWSDMWAKLHPGEPGYTFAATKPDKRIDYQFANAELADKISAIDIVFNTEDPAIKQFPSDHYGVMTTFAL